MSNAVQTICGASQAAVSSRNALLAELRDEGEEDSEVFSRFQLVEKLGEGTYGKVYKVISKDSGDVFALKKIAIVYEEEGVPGTAIREVSLLKECDHPNVIKLHNVFSDSSALYLLFEFLDMDLRAYLRRNGKNPGKMSDPAALRSAASQCFRAIEFCHDHRILHRDLKPQNILVDVAKFRLKLADFGLARSFTVPLKAYTHEVVTLWYRAPEILLGQNKYANPIDIWSLGCIVAEMATGQALFPGDSEIDTIFRMFRVLGTPTEEVWPGISYLRDFKQEFPKWQPTQFADVRRAGPGLGDAGISILGQCLRFNPVERPSARRLLQHDFFHTEDLTDFTSTGQHVSQCCRP